jgi:hypothetical protein
MEAIPSFLCVCTYFAAQAVSEKACGFIPCFSKKL